MFYCFLAVTILMIKGTNAASCPDELGWIQAGNSCYLVSLEALDWYSAQEVQMLLYFPWSYVFFQFCWSKGSYLAEVQSREEENLLDEFLIQGTLYWLGLDDLAREGRYVWAESHQEATYFNWAPSEPDGHDASDCIFKAATKEAYKGWLDAPCTWDTWTDHGEIHAVCEYDI